MLNNKLLISCKISKIFNLLTILRLDIYAILYFTGAAVPLVTISQLIQDKYCVNTLNADPSKCLHIESIGVEFEETANRVITFSSTFTNYISVIKTTPGIIFSVFFGYWIDSYPNHIKYLLALPCLGGCLAELVIILNVVYFKLDVYYILLSFIPNCFFGGIFVVLSGSYTYITRTTKAKYRALRFAVLDLFIYGATPLATAIGGKLLTIPPWLDGQYRNYLAVFLVSFICYFIALIWVLIFLDDSYCASEVLNLSDTIANENLTPQGFGKVARNIFSMSTVTNMVKVCSRKRSNNRRKILWHLVLSLTIITIGVFIDTVIGFQFTQKVYHWNAVYYSYVNSIVSLVFTVINTILSAILIHKLHFSDSSLFIIGIVSLIISLSIIGGYNKPIAYFIGKLAQMFYGFPNISIRSIVSRIIDRQESGQVFALLACFESIAPSISNILFSTIFKTTIETFPGTTYHVAAFLMFHPFVVSLWLSLTRHKWDPMDPIKLMGEKVTARECVKSQSGKSDNFNQQ